MPIRTKQLAHVCIFADDLAETRDFYRDVLGMEIVFNFERKGDWYGFYLGAGRPQPRRGLPQAGGGILRPERRSTTSASRSSCIDDAVAHIRSRGVAVTDKKFACDDTWQAWITDPNGVRIELFEYTAKSAQFVGGDRIADW